MGPHSDVRKQSPLRWDLGYVRTTVLCLAGLCFSAAQADWVDWNIGNFYLGSSLGIAKIHHMDQLANVNSLISVSGADNLSRAAIRAFFGYRHEYAHLANFSIEVGAGTYGKKGILTRSTNTNTMPIAPLVQAEFHAMDIQFLWGRQWPFRHEWRIGCGISLQEVKLHTPFYLSYNYEGYDYFTSRPRFTLSYHYRLKEDVNLRVELSQNLGNNLNIFSSGGPTTAPVFGANAYPPVTMLMFGIEFIN